MTDIGKGDVVAAVKQRLVGDNFTGGRGAYIIMPGDRATVLGFADPRPNFCDACGETAGPGMILAEYPLIRGLSWCRCEWRKIGGSQGDTVRQFEAYLKDKPLIDTEVMKRLLAPGRPR